MGNLIFCTILMEKNSFQKFETNISKLHSTSGISYWLQDSRKSANTLLRFALRFSINSKKNSNLWFTKSFDFTIPLISPCGDKLFLFTVFTIFSTQIDLQYQETGGRGTCALNRHKSLTIFPEFQIKNGTLHTARYSKHVWPFYSIMHEVVKYRISLNISFPSPP